jgi:hypothetical protein
MEEYYNNISLQGSNMFPRLLVLTFLILAVRPYLYLGRGGWDITEYGTGNPSYQTFSQTPLVIPPGYVPVEPLSILIRGWGTFYSDDYYFILGVSSYLWKLLNDDPLDDPFDDIVTCYTFPCDPLGQTTTYPDRPVYVVIPNPYDYNYGPWFGTATLTQAQTNTILSNPSQIDWSIYFANVGNLYYLNVYFAFGVIGFGGDPHITTHFGEFIDIDDGTWNVVSTENFDINILVENSFSRQVVLISAGVVVHMFDEDRSPVILVNGIPLIPESSESVLGIGVIHYSHNIQDTRQTPGSLARYWIAEVTIQSGRELIVFHIALYPGAGLFYEMVYKPSLHHQQITESRSVATHSGILFAPPIDSKRTTLSVSLKLTICFNVLTMHNWILNNQRIKLFSCYTKGAIKP